MMTPEWITSETIDRLRNMLVFSKRFPPIVRVRRRGFPREARRGFDVRRSDGIYRVVRRTNWNLWLEKVREPDGTPLIGDTVRVRLPKRYQMSLHG